MLKSEAKRAGRPADAVKLLAASKQQSVETILEAAAAGQRDFGENTVQEALDKILAVDRDDLTWHFIGRLQANKTRHVAEHFQWVHTLERPKIAARLNRQRPYYAAPLDVCIQVNIDREQSKSGVFTEEVPQLAAAIAELPRLRLRGLMCLPAPRQGFEQQREPFARLREALESLQQDGFEVDTLSMGMSDDFAAAIHEGSTIVRIGTALFGPRGQ
jgi:pyridoxal phosphate enzyme (YggS family)